MESTLELTKFKEVLQKNLKDLNHLRLLFLLALSSTYVTIALIIKNSGKIIKSSSFFVILL